MTGDDIDPATLEPRVLASLVKRSPVEQLRALMCGGQRRAVLDKIFEDMPTVFRADRPGPEKEIVHWHIGDRPDGGEDVYELVIADGACQVSASPRQVPRLALTIGAVDFLRVVTGAVSPTMLFLRGRMKAKGDLGLAMRFPKMFDVLRE